MNEFERISEFNSHLLSAITLHPRTVKWKWWYLRFPIWKPAPGNDDPSRVRIQISLIECNLVSYRRTWKVIWYHQFCQTTKAIFVINGNKTFISQIIRVPLDEKLDFFSLLGFEAKSEFGQKVFKLKLPRSELQNNIWTTRIWLLVEKQHRFFDLVQRILDPTLILVHYPNSHSHIASEVCTHSGLRHSGECVTH